MLGSDDPCACPSVFRACHEQETRAEGYAVASKVALGYARRSAMYAVVRRYEGVTDPAEAGRRVDEGFVPLLRQVPGFVAYYWIDAGDGVMVSTSIYEDQAGADESVRRATDFVRDNLASLLPNPPQVTAGQVVAAG
jgi:hypothetical protein